MNLLLNPTYYLVVTLLVGATFIAYLAARPMSDQRTSVYVLFTVVMVGLGLGIPFGYAHMVTANAEDALHPCAQFQFEYDGQPWAGQNVELDGQKVCILVGPDMTIQLDNPEYFVGMNPDAQDAALVTWVNNARTTPLLGMPQ